MYLSRSPVERAWTALDTLLDDAAVAALTVYGVALVALSALAY